MRANKAEAAKWCGRRSWKAPITCKRQPKSAEQVLFTCIDDVASWASVLSQLPYPEVALALVDREDVERIGKLLLVEVRIEMMQDQLMAARSELAVRWLAEWSAALMVDTDLDQRYLLHRVRMGG